MKSCVEAAYRHYVARIDKPPGPMLEDYSEVVRLHQAFVAEEAGQVVAVLVLVREAAGLVLDNVSVHPDFQRQGLGSRLIALAETEAREQGYTQLDLYTHESMTENIEIYISLGYVETERRREDGYDRVYMRKDLS